MYKQILLIFILTISTNTQEENDAPTHSHQEALEKLLKEHKQQEFDWKEASLLFFEAYTSVPREMLNEMMNKDFNEGDQGYFEQIVMKKSYEGIKDYFQQQGKEKFDANFMRKVISSDEILQFILPYLSEVYQGLNDQGVNLDNVEEL